MNTELRQRYLDEVTARLPDVLPGLRLLDLQNALVAVVAEAAGEILDLLEPARRR